MGSLDLIFSYIRLCNCDRYFPKLGISKKGVNYITLNDLVDKFLRFLSITIIFQFGII